MTPVYRNTGLRTRNAAYLAVIVAALLWGIFELWRATHEAGGEASTGATFGVLFIGGAIYSLWQIVNEWRDVVVSLDRDANGALVATVWQPTGPKKITGEFHNWRFHVTLAGRNTRLYFIHADNSAVPRPLRFDVRRGIDLAGLRAIAPEPVAEYEAAIAPAAKVS